MSPIGATIQASDSRADSTRPIFWSPERVDFGDPEEGTGRAGDVSQQRDATVTVASRVGPMARPIHGAGRAPEKADRMLPERTVHVRPTAVAVLVLFTLGLAVAGCGADAASQSAGVGSTPSATSPSADASAAPINDLAAIACATDDPEDVGALTGAWAGDDGGIYYIRQVGDCVWWFATDLADIELGNTRHPGWSRTLPPGAWTVPKSSWNGPTFPSAECLGGGGLTVKIDEGGDSMRITEQRGNDGFGGRYLVRTNGNPDAIPSESATP